MDTDLLSDEKMVRLLGDRGLLSFIHCTEVSPVPSEVMLADEFPSINNSSGLSLISLTLETFSVCVREKEHIQYTQSKISLSHLGGPTEYL